MVLGGASLAPAAAAMQLHVLIAILCVTWLVAAGRYESGPRDY